MLNKEEKKALLKIARETLKNYFENKPYKFIGKLTENLNKKLGAFVTLKNSGSLRGCIGYIYSDRPLHKTIPELAKESAFSDSRFNKLSAEELPKTKIEISVLSEPKKISSYKEVELGRHGVIVRQGLKSGLFLPQVATENNWDLPTFMNYLCEHKAGLSADVWKNGKAELYTFESQVFSE